LQESDPKASKGDLKLEKKHVKLEEYREKTLSKNKTNPAGN
jgi:hypothetical protein